MTTKACNFKGVQQIFLLNQQKATSCCRADPVPITDLSMADLVQIWNQEAQQLAQGQQLDGCRSCWNKENAGLESFRQLHAEPQPIQVELDLSNLCNHMCSYCSPKFSSEWQRSIQQQGTFSQVSKTAIANLELVPQATNLESWLDQIQTHIAGYDRDSVVLSLIGGEPLMQHYALEKTLDMMQPNIKQLAITTNLNPPSSRFFDQLLDTWPTNKLTFNISIDAVPEFNHVPRAGFDQQRFERNFAKLQQAGVKFKFLCVVSVLNIFDLGAFLSKYSQIEIMANQLYNPACLEIGTIPREQRQQILDQLPDSTPAWIRSELAQPTVAVDLKLKEQYNYLSQYFSRTNTVIPSNMQFGQYWNLLQQRFNK
jgi:organic radical activating enzyme